MGTSDGSKWVLYALLYVSVDTSWNSLAFICLYLLAIGGSKLNKALATVPGDRLCNQLPQLFSKHYTVVLVWFEILFDLCVLLLIENVGVLFAGVKVRALWRYWTLNVADIVRWVGLTKYVMYRKRGAFDSAHAYILNYIRFTFNFKK